MDQTLVSIPNVSKSTKIERHRDQVHFIMKCNSTDIAREVYEQIQKAIDRGEDFFVKLDFINPLLERESNW